tara:strand:- start:2156 stop:3877 length:1722 start_codon:yes stop_codon:yes gene_type:complete
MQTNDAKRAVLIALGIPAGAMPEMTRAWLVDLGALPDNGDTVTDLSWDFLTRVNSLSGSISDMWFIWLGNKGATGATVSDRWNSYWSNGLDGIEAANEAVARLDSSTTDYIKDVIFQYVFNEAFAGRWQYVKRMWIARTNLDSAYTCLKTGNVATPSDTFTFVDQDAVVIPSGESVNFNYDMSGDFSSIADYSFGSTISGMNRGTNLTPAVMSGTAGVSSSVILGWNHTNSYWSVSINGGTTTGATDTFDNGLNTTMRGDIDPATDLPRLRYKDRSSAASWMFASNVADTLYQNIQSGSAVEQNWVMTYVADYDMAWEGFRDNTNAMIEALAQTAVAFSAPIQDGDSLEIDDSGSGYFGWVSALTEVSTDDMVLNGSGGKSLFKIAATSSPSYQSLDLAIAANPSADSLILGAGINDIINTIAPVHDIATINGYIDNIFAQFVAASNLRHLLIREVAASGGRWDAQNNPTEQAARWQPYTDQLNAHIASKVAATDGAYLVSAYEATESTVPAYAGYQEGIIRTTPITMTGGTRGNGSLTVEGVHWLQFGARIVGALGDAAIKSARYYKGGRLS